jgi:S1-C subfamily serine protease
MSPAGAFAIPLTIAHQVYTNRKALAPVDLPGDLIVAVDDKPIQDAQAFSQALGSYEPGDRVSFSIIRAGKPFQIAVTLEREPL